MSRPSLEEFRERLINSGLLTAVEADAELSSLRSVDDIDAVSTESFARYLIAQETLTAWQAKQIYRGRLKSLVLGNYVLLDKLGQGGMGMVFKAEHRIMQRVVALKTLSPEITKSPQLVARFRREVQVAARLEHPHVVTAYDAANEGNVHYLVMQFVDGDDLSSLVRRQGVLKLGDAVNFLRQAALGLQYAHEQGVIHRDVKPSNLLVDATGTVRVLDMGLARFESSEEQSSDITASGAVMGTIDYMSPEQAENTRQANAQSDVYSLGCTLYFLLTGRPTFTGESIIQRILAHRDAVVPELTGIVEDATPEIEKIFHKMVAKNPADRFQSMAEVVDALDHLGVEKVVPPNPLDTSAHNIDDFLLSINSESPAPISPTKRGATTPPRNKRSSNSEPLTQKADEDFQLITPGEKKSAVRETASGDKILKGFMNPKWIGGFVVFGSLLVAMVIVFNNGEQGASETRVANSPLQNENNVLQPEIQERTPVESPQISTPGPIANPNETRLLFDGQNDYAVFPQFSLNDRRPVTLEAWLTPLSTAPAANPLTLMGSQWMTLFHTGSEWGVGKLHSENSTLTRANNSFQIGVPIHIAGVWDGEVSRLFINGKLLPTRISPALLYPTQSGLFLGGAPAETMGENDPNRFSHVEIQQVRISNGARYIEEFVPQAVFIKEESTTGLYLLHEGRGLEIRDSSGNGHHGTIHGAVWNRE